MDTLAWLCAGLFIFGYFLIALEQKIGTHKVAIALIMGGMLWVLAALQLQDVEKISEAIFHTGAEIFNIVAFLLPAMALIEILVHYRLFDLIRAKLIKMKINDRQQFLIIMGITFLLSGVLDNIAITIAMLQIGRRFFVGKNLFIAGAGIVIAANAGGAWSPIGDVTTILLWLADKFTALEVIKYAFLPSLTLAAVTIALLYPKLNDTDFVKREEGDVARLRPSEKTIIGAALGSFSLPLAMSFLGLPPYIGLLLGLGITWAIIELAKHHTRNQTVTHMTADIEKLLQSVDLAAVKYIMGILLAVGALATVGVLPWLSHVAVGADPSTAHLVGINMALGAISGIVDNASLVAVAIKTFPIDDPQLWSLAAIAAGNGGSLMIIASAAGVVAMGSLKNLDISTYFKIATVPVIAGIAAAYTVWLLQYMFIF